MHMRWIGIALLLATVFAAGIMAYDVKIFSEAKAFAKEQGGGQNGRDIVDLVVQVPPFNSSLGWVGFNITLPNEGKTNYQATGLILPDDEDPQPDMVMAAVSGTGADLLKWDGFSEAAWNQTKVYAAASLDSTYRYSKVNFFEFGGLDSPDRYVLLFRGRKNETASRPILISVTETWLSPQTLIPFTPFNTSALAMVSIIGSVLIVYDLRLEQRRKARRHLHPKALAPSPRSRPEPRRR